MPLILGAQSAVAGGFDVANSCRFNPADSPSLYKTPGGAGNQKTWTYSCWVKKTKAGSRQGIINVNGSSNPYFFVEFIASDAINIQDYDGSQDTDLITTSLYQDVGAWYHICVAYDTTQAVDTNRIKLYVNGTQVTDFSTSTYCAQDFVTQMNSTYELFVGKAATQEFGGYMAEVCVIDGQQLDATSFGEFDSDSPTIWKPKDISALTAGTNGFYLDFADSANLGNDVFGGTDLTENNIVAANQMIDSPTNNFCTMNSTVGTRSGFTWSYGNTKLITGNNDGSGSTMGSPSGKWYYEIYINTLGNFYGGWQDLYNIEADEDEFVPAGCVAMNNTPDIYYNGTGTAQSSGNKGVPSFTSGDYIGLAFDTDNLTCWYSKTGQWYTGDSGTASTLTRAQVSANANGFDCTTAAAFSSSSVVAPFMGCSTSDTTNSFNFGNGRFGATALTGTTYTDDNEQGIFKYEPPDGFRALCTKNLGEFG